MQNTHAAKIIVFICSNYVCIFQKLSYDTQNSFFKQWGHWPQKQNEKALWNISFKCVSKQCCFLDHNLKTTLAAYLWSLHSVDAFHRPGSWKQNSNNKLLAFCAIVCLLENASVTSTFFSNTYLTRVIYIKFFFFLLNLQKVQWLCCHLNVHQKMN